MVIAPEHKLVEQVMDRPAVAEYVEQSGKSQNWKRTEESRQKRVSSAVWLRLIQ